MGGSEERRGRWGVRQATTRISGPETVTQSSGIETIHMEAERRLVKRNLKKYVRSGCDTYGGTKKTCTFFYM